MQEKVLTVFSSYFSLFPQNLLATAFFAFCSVFFAPRGIRVKCQTM